ncbi:MAG TPA: caspase family protein, partial [Puia sp.]
MASIFAVLVGINDYPFKPLQGCINDVDAVEGYLKSNYPADRLNIRRLTDNGPIKPTRQGLIDAFDFFADAKPGDTCLFYYSGHGSFSPAPAGLDNNGELYVQSFVCLDSRGEGGKDLVDKEMAYLIWRRVRSHPDVHFVAITDCCHSGTITKGWIDDSRVTDRMASPGIGHVPATLEEYVGFSDSDFYTKGAAGYFAGQAKHIHLAASRDNQTSKELLIDGGGIRGAFTWSLLKTLNESSGQITYRKLLNKAKTLTEGLVSNQNPLVHFNGGLPASTNDTIFLSQEKTEKEAVPIPKFIEQASVPISISVAEQVPAAVKQLLIDAYPTARLESSILKNTTGQYIIRALNESEVFLSQPGNDGPVFEPEKVENAGDAQKFLRQCDK